MRYFKRCVKKTSTGEGGSAKPGKVKQVYTIRDVIKNKYQELIEEYNPYKPTDKEFLGSYQKALSKVQEGMSKENLKDVQKIVDLWNSEGASSEVKLK